MPCCNACRKTAHALRASRATLVPRRTRPDSGSGACAPPGDGRPAQHLGRAAICAAEAARKGCVSAIVLEVGRAVCDVAGGLDVNLCWYEWMRPLLRAVCGDPGMAKRYLAQPVIALDGATAECLIAQFQERSNELASRSEYAANGLLSRIGELSIG